MSTEKPKEIQLLISAYLYCFILNCQNLKAKKRCPLVDEWTNKLWYI